METMTSIINKQLDTLYNQTAGAVLKQVSKAIVSQDSGLQRALQALDEEALKLDASSDVFTMTNPFLVTALIELYQVFLLAQVLIRVEAGAIEQGAVATSYSAVALGVFAQLGKALRTPEWMSKVLSQPQALNTLIAGTQWKIPEPFSPFVSTEAWQKKMNTWADGYYEFISKSVSTQIDKGVSPTDIAQSLRDISLSLPYAATENITKTLQYTSYRAGSVKVEEENTWIIAYKVRIAQLDNRTCLACIALHGTILMIGQPVDDHYRGRCSAYYVIIGGKERPEQMMADGQLVPYQSGEEWFASLPEERQQQQASFVATPGKYNAYKAGNPLSSFVLEKSDETFGDMNFENSIFGAFGKDASKYYVKGE